MQEGAEIIRVLRAAGHQAWLVGGCVRDLLLGVPPQDFDVATSARPEQIAGLFPAARPVGAHFGVMLVGEVEVAT
ncbi:MAG: CCA tRNA nucleotidyltransferase, partial [Acidobacteria bacterium]|nr:CCA tRNA nucleotidyltransferase [Bryobacteraceae bacterium CoA2 C42]